MQINQVLLNLLNKPSEIWNIKFINQFKNGSKQRNKANSNYPFGDIYEGILKDLPGQSPANARPRFRCLARIGQHRKGNP